MGLTTIDGYVSQVGNNKVSVKNFAVDSVATSATCISSQLIAVQNMGLIATMESLPSGVTSYKLVGGRFRASTITCTYIVAKMVDMGNINIATPTFTDGSSMPTMLEGNVSRVLSSQPYGEVTTVLNATPGSITVTYVDQDGNTAETTASMALTASAAVGTMFPITLNTGDTGARDITNSTRTGGTSPTGVIKYWGVIPLAVFQPQTVAQYDLVNLTTSDICPVDVGAGDNIYLLCIGSGSAKAAYGSLFFVGDN